MSNKTDLQANKDYKDWFQLISRKITTSRIATSIKVNTELLQLYYDIGSSIIDVQNRLGLGSQIIDTLSSNIKNKFPKSTGFSVRNLKYMRAFAEAYPNFSIVQVSLAQNEKVQVSKL